MNNEDISELIVESHINKPLGLYTNHLTFLKEIKCEIADQFTKICNDWNPVVQLYK